MLSCEEEIAKYRHENEVLTRTTMILAEAVVRWCKRNNLDYDVATVQKDAHAQAQIEWNEAHSVASQGL